MKQYFGALIWNQVYTKRLEEYKTLNVSTHVYCTFISMKVSMIN